jgi:hypothetical protein
MQLGGVNDTTGAKLDTDVLLVLAITAREDLTGIISCTSLMMLLKLNLRLDAAK